MFLGCQAPRHDGYPKGGGGQRPKFLDPSAYSNTVLYTATIVCMIIKLHEMKIFTGSTCPKNFVTRVVHDLLAVANILVLPHNAMCNRGTSHLSVCLVRTSRSCIVSKRLKISSHLLLSHDTIPRGTFTRASKTWVQKNTPISTNISVSD